MSVEVTVSEGTPVTYNDPVLARRLNAVMLETFGADATLTYEQRGMGPKISPFLYRRKLMCQDTISLWVVLPLQLLQML